MKAYPSIPPLRCSARDAACTGAAPALHRRYERTIILLVQTMTDNLRSPDSRSAYFFNHELCHREASACLLDATRTRSRRHRSCSCHVSATLVLNSFAIFRCLYPFSASAPHSSGF